MIRNKYFIWYVAVLIFLVGVIADLTTKHAVHFLASVFAGLIALFLSLSGIIYYYLRQQKDVPTYLVIITDICVICTVLIMGGLIIKGAIEFSLGISFPRDWENSLNSFYKSGLAWKLFGLIQLIPLGILFFLSMRKNHMKKN